MSFRVRTIFLLNISFMVIGLVAMALIVLFHRLAINRTVVGASLATCGERRVFAG